MKNSCLKPRFVSLAMILLVNSGHLVCEGVFIPKKEPKLPYAPKFISNLFREEREKHEKEELEEVEKVVKKVVSCSDKELEKQAEELVKDREKFEKLLAAVSKDKVLRKEHDDAYPVVTKETEQLLDSFYKDEQLLKKDVSIKLKNSDIREAIELISKAAGLDFVIDPRVSGFISNIDLKNVSVASALKIILSANRPRLAIIKDIGVWRILRLRDAIQVLKGGAEKLRQQDFVSDFVIIYNARWSESFKLRIEKMWYGVIGASSNGHTHYLVFDDSTRKVFFKGRKRQVADFKKFLRQVDSRIPQVRIDARVIIAGKDFEESFGLQISGVYNRSASVSKKGWSYIGFGPVSTGGGGDIKPENLADWALNLLPTTANKFLNAPFIFGGRDLDTKRLNLVLNAAENRSEIKTILKPTLLVNSDETAQLLVGQEVPIETSIQERLEGSLRDINTINYKDLGLKLKIKPIVAPDQKSVFLDIFVENSYVKGSTNATEFDARKSIIATTRSRNRVLLKSGQTTLIGGLISDEKRKDKHGIPLLQDIPLLGVLFRGSKRTRSDDQLMIFISPTVV